MFIDEPIDRANRDRQSERNTPPPPYNAHADDNAGQRDSNVRLEPLKPGNEGSVSNGFLNSGASSDMVSPDSGRFTAEDPRYPGQQLVQDSRSEREDGGHEDASENDSLLPVSWFTRFD